MAEAFVSSQDQIDVELVHGSGNYEGIMQALLRGRIVGDVPDVSFLGFNFMRMTQDTGAGYALNDFIAAETDLDDRGYIARLSNLCRRGDDILGMPFAISMPVIYYNLDLLDAVGADTSDLSYSWDEIIDVAARVDALGDDVEGSFFSYDASGNWLLKALVESAGGTLMSEDDTEVLLDSAEGQWAFDVLNRLGDAGFANVSRSQARQAFAAGQLAILVDSSSGLNARLSSVEDRFTFGVGRFPVPHENGLLPAGGNCVVMTTDDPERQAAAWEFIKFVTSAEGQRILASNSGYVPNNRMTLQGDGEIGQRFTTDPHYQVPALTIEVAGPSYAFPGENSVRITGVIEEYMRQVLTGETEPEETLQDLKAEVEGLL
ncbi:MAG: extracellular solute-binding protein [Hyphomonas sp.]|nr:extracellular solute-binding protein [Hyphomonas sp.]